MPEDTVIASVWLCSSGRITGTELG